LDTTVLAERVAELPWVAAVDISRHLSGTVEITVTERTPVFALVRAGGFSLVDSHGQAFDFLVEPPAGLLPVTMSPPNDRLLADAAVVAAALPETVRAQISGLTVTSADHIEFDLINGARLFWGSAEQSDLKAQAAAALLTVPASYYDVSAPVYPAARP